ncbi:MULTISPECIES: hypothetical protein [Actinoalloteichus]|uniref:Cobyrinic acid a,c-diamide synthase n=1 Tax=Actinoalloteichus fjordicus TaxID=1612552 RepID=A0AAC9LED4_9PSEU|nr:MULTISPECIES: hypothetical protein [Actinoalloteichus]APU16318.1 hypothetical protein UA74_21465 [Actinoalloteichus fjordicus]APU22377.1 hypothetical protein UA75_21940 [Actinoalloteichus sp. GBA129-24]
MTRRAALPGAAELFRSTTPETGRPSGEASTDVPDVLSPAVDTAVTRGSGRRRHDTKITVYVSSEELVALERARLVLLAEHGVTADRGRVVREAVAVVLADLQARGADSILVERLRGEAAG